MPTITTTGTVNTVCFSSSSQTATLPYTVTTNTPVSYSIDWNAAANTAGLADQGTTAFSFSSGGGNLTTIAIPANVAANTYTGTMTIQNANCSATQAVQITINATSVGGSINTPAAICSGSTSGLLTLSGHTGSVVKWQSAVSPFSTWTDISNTTTTYTSGALTQTTQFRAVVKNGVCSEINSAVTTITVNPLPTITTTGTVNTVCFSSSSQTATLPYTATTNTAVSYSIDWNAAANTAGLADQGSTAFSFSSGGGNLTTIAIPGNVAANTYTGTMTIQNANCSATQAIQITINATSVGGTINTPAAICSGSTSGLLTLSGHTGSVVKWQSAVSPFSTWTDISNTTTTYTSGALTQTTQFRAVVKNGVCSEINSAVTTITVNPLPTITTTGTVNTVCFSSSSQTATLPYTATTNTPVSYSIDWNAAANTAGLADQGTTAFSFSSGGGNLTTIAIPANVAANTYTGTMTIQNANCSATQAVQITINATSVGGSINTPAAICSGSTSGLLTLSGHTGSVVKWQSAVSPFSTWTDISNTTTTYTSGALTQTTQFRAVVKNGVCSEINSAVTTITVNPLPTITTTGTINTVCFSSSSQTATLPYTATTNTPVSYSIDWNAAANTAGLADQGSTAFSFSSGGGNLSTIAIPANVAANTYTGTMTIQNGNCSVTQAIQITINATSVGGSVTGGTAICSGQTSGLLTLSGYTGTIIGWEYGVEIFSTISWFPIAHTGSTYTSGSLTETTQFRAVIKNGVCSTVYSNPTTVTVNPLLTITTSGTLTDICFSTSVQTAVLPYSATTNTPVSYSITWDAAANTAGLTNQGTTAFAFSSGGGNLSTIAIPANVAANTYTGTMTIQNANCSATQAIQITIKPTPTTPSLGTITQPTCVLTTGSVILNGLPGAVTWTITQSGTASTIYTGTGTSYTVSALAVGSYQFTVEYSGSCTSSLSSSVVVNPLVTNTYNSGSWSNGTPTINQNLVFASAYTSAGAGLGNLSGCTCIVNNGINVVISSLDTLTIYYSITNNGGTLTFENNASLVQIANVANIGNLIFKRTSKPMKNFDFTYWASPVTGQTLYNLSPNTLADKYFSYTGTAWKIENPVSTIMKPGTGYIIRTPKEGLWPNGENVVFPYSQQVQFVGVPNNGNITGDTVIAGNYYLVGNPYSSALDADKFLFANPDPNNSAILDGTIYFWTHNTAISHSGSKYIYSSDDYASYNGVGGIATLPSASGGDLPTGKIASGQSFFALASANGTIVFNNGMRITGNNTQFFKPGKTSKQEMFEKHRVWLNMTNTGGAFKQLLIGYVEGATNEFDSDFDGLSFDGNAFIDFYSINMGSNLVIQGRAVPFTDSDVVSLGYRTIIAGDFTISIDHADGMLSNQPVFIEDKLTNTIHDLTQSNYTFNTGTGVFNNRLALRYTNRTLTTDNFEESDNNVAVWVENKNIKLRSEKEYINKVFVYDVSGKLVYSDTTISASEVTINNVRFKNELLLVKIVLANNNTLTKKVVTAFK
ncbi:T9SS sorting signal type C domain-containing protein [Flavobacterium ajazii]|uniref:T9SS sorting signal type C domain-containing protein n=1 Tax=Flavobacterium ajazii TaxID=2692318 RepID=UPI0013D1B3AA|nr:T9SS sorting signal type C domain-containing protein [Flavobacterium ajazii]